MPSPFLGQLNQNEIFSALYNMIISIQTEANNISGTYSEIVDAARVDGGLFGDTKLYIDTDVLKTHPWGNDNEAANLLALDRPANPSTQDIVLNKFRQVRVTIDQYLSKRAFHNEGEFSSFNGVLLGWVYTTKRVYDSRTYNTFIGTDVSTVGEQSQSIDLTTIVGSATGEEAARLRGQAIAKHIADLIVDMKDATRDYNDYEYLRSFAEGDIKIIWNANYVNEITKLDLPTIFHKDGLVAKLSQYVLPERYFGTPNAAKVLAANNDGSYRSLVEKDYVTASGTVHVFPADLIPAAVDIEKGEGYTPDPLVMCKVCTVLPPFMSAFEVGTTFFNPRSLTENHYLTYGHNTLEHLKGKPWITIKETGNAVKNAKKLFGKK